MSAHLCLARPEGQLGEQALAVGPQHRTPGRSGYCLGNLRPPGLAPENPSPQLCPHTMERSPGEWNQRRHVCSGALSPADPQGPWRSEWKLRPGESSPFVGSGVRVEAGVWTPGRQVRALPHPGFQDEGSRPPCYEGEAARRQRLRGGEGAGAWKAVEGPKGEGCGGAQHYQREYS